MTDNQDSLIREVREELEREKYARLWDKYAGYIIAGAMAIVVGVGGYQYWKNARQSAIFGAGAQYEAALGSVTSQDPAAIDKTKARAVFAALAKDGPGGYKTLGQLQVAATHVAAGDKSAALAAYDALAKQSDADPLLRNFAALQAATLRAGEADWTEMENRLNPLTVGLGYWRYSALQLLGIVALEAGKIDKARGVFEDLLVDPKVPQSVRQRASLYMARIVAHEMAVQGGTEETGTTAPSAQPAAGTTPKSSDGVSGSNKSGESAPANANEAPANTSGP